MPIAAPLPANEDARLAALYEYNILDTPPEPAFDRLTALAAEICDAPISVISLVDRDRQWFKSRLGVDSYDPCRENSFCGHAILDDNVLVIPDATQDERFLDNPRVTGLSHVRSYAGAPLIARGDVKLGALCVIHDEVTTLSARQISQLEKLAALVVDELELRMALEDNRAARESLQIQTAELKFAKSHLESQAADMVRLAEDYQLLCRTNEHNRRFVETLIETVPIPIFSRDEQENFTHVNPAFEAFQGLEAREIIGRHITEICDPQIARDTLAEDAQIAADPASRQAYERKAVVPGLGEIRDIVVHKAAIRGDDGTVQGVVGAIIDVTEQKALQANLEILATTDPLTGAANRRAFLERTESELQRSRRYSYPLSLITLDIDKFKAINDTHGHDVGDKVLQLVCRACTDTIRDSVDLLARWGGEEFAILAPETGTGGAATLAERLRQKITGQELVLDDKPISVTASFGVVTVESDRGTSGIDDALKQADACLYESKRGGRNRVTISGEADRQIAS